MRFHSNSRVFLVLLLVCLLPALLFAGCKQDPVTPSVTGDPVPSASQRPEASPSSAPDEDGDGAIPDDAIRVRTVQELADAIAPGAEIVLEPGTYNFSDLKAGVYSDNLFISDCGDGMEAVVTDLDNLTIRGVSAADTTLVTSSRYADVLRFESCSGVVLADLTMGHLSEPGTCTGDVLEFDYCSWVTLEGLDLYGCGTYGLSAFLTSDLEMRGSVIRDCAYGILWAVESTNLYFADCAMRNCTGYDMLDTNTSELTFERCVFRGNESDWNFITEEPSTVAIFRDCRFGAWESARLADAVRTRGGVVCDEACAFTGTAVPTLTRISTVEALFDNIAPGAVLELAPGRYDLSAYAEKLWADDPESWNSRHPYVQLSECWDGVEVLIRDVEVLTVLGGGAGMGDTEIVVSPRYADVLSLLDSGRITLCNLTLGHTDGGECLGGVLYLEDCRDVCLSRADLYGCGVIGISAYNVQNLYMYGSVIRECEYGPLDIASPTGSFTFIRSTFRDSGGGFGFYDYEPYVVSFLYCSFGDNESNLFWYSDVYTTGCEWSENMQYPDYGDYENEGDFREGLSVIPFDAETIADSSWYGHLLCIPDEGVELGLPFLDSGEELFITLSMESDGTCTLTGLYEEPVSFAWAMDSDYSAALTSADGPTASLSLYAHTDSEESSVWLCLSVGEYYLWMY